MYNQGNCNRKKDFEQYVYESSRLCFPMEIRPENRHLMIFTAYADESGIHQQSGNIVLAGYVSTSPQWNSFETEWKEALAGFGIPAFHMTDFANHVSPYNTWSEA